ncbi:MAG: rRNA maturation RNase YbeY [Woeseiaceae bacterium]|nr:rRNA maturation RNase YbeY [Woeseiaceae bacterium]
MNADPASLVDVHIAEGLADIPDPSILTRWVELALDEIDKAGAVSVSLSVVDEEESRRLNREYRDQDKATNVLSFPMEFDVAPPPDEPLLLGDLAICGPVVAREAREQEKTPEDHWAHMVTHGVLHLAGHDHMNDEEAEVMERLEKKILARGGVADPYIARD